MYIIDHTQQNQLIREMTQLRKDMENCIVYFHHTLADQMWKSFFPRATEEDLGPKILRKEPIPTSLSEHVSICLTEAVPENAIGLGIDMSAKMELWPELIQIIEDNRRVFESDQIRLFLSHLKVNRYKENILQLKINRNELSLSDHDLKRLLWRSRKLKLKSVLF